MEARGSRGNQPVREGEAGLAPGDDQAALASGRAPQPERFLGSRGSRGHGTTSSFARKPADTAQCSLRSPSVDICRPFQRPAWKSQPNKGRKPYAESTQNSNDPCIRCEPGGFANQATSQRHECAYLSLAALLRRNSVRTFSARTCATTACSVGTSSADGGGRSVRGA